MTYYKSYEYTERYYIRFKDISDTSWRISIQDPTFEGTATELTGAAFPIEWEGNGNESQVDVVLGSSGHIRLVVLDGQSSIFNNGNLLPTNINDRRVQLLREMSAGQWDIYWQGYIEPSTYSQDFDSAPFEIELPIISAIAASEYFELPDLDNNNLLEEASNVWALLAVSIDLLGCDYVSVYTNKPEYEDFNGNTSLNEYGQQRHWSEGKATCLNFYDLTSGYTTPQTVKDVLELLCYPYGKIYEYGRAIIIAISWKDSASGNAQWYMNPIYDTLESGGIDYDTIIMSARRFDPDIAINVVDLADVLPAGTDNTQSIISQPKSVRFSNSISSEGTIFELTEDYLRPNLPDIYPINQGLVYEKDFSDGGQNHYRIHYKINKENVDFNAFTRGGSTSDPIDGLYVETNATNGNTDYPFCRVSEMTASTNTDVSSSIKTPMAFLFDFGDTSASTYTYVIKFNVKRPVFTNPLYNQIKLSIKAWAYNETDALEQMNVRELVQVIGGVVFYVKDTTNGMYYVYDGTTWQWQTTQGWISGSDLPKEGEEYVLRFTEDRSGGDSHVEKDPHVLQICLMGYRRNSGDDWQKKLYSTLKIEYEKSTIFFQNRKYYEICPPNKQLGFFETNASNGDSIDIEFKTRCLRGHYLNKDTPQTPANSFCDAQRYIDVLDRKKIEIQAAQFKRYDGVGYDKFDIVSRPVFIADGSDVYVPVAVGMNPRMNSVRLVLVSTNVNKPTT